MHANHLSDGRRRVTEQLFGDVIAEHGDEAPLLHVDIRERVARGKCIVLDEHIRGRDAEDEDVARRAIAPLHVGHRRGPAGLQRDGLRVGHGAFDVGDVLGRDDRPALNLFPRLIVDEADLNRIAADLKGIDADDGPRETLAHVGVHALNDGDDGDEECDRDDDAEQREERAELMAPNGLKGQAESFEERHGLQN